jgi:hypothetical protein
LKRGTGEWDSPGAVPETTLGDLRIVATLLTFAFGLKLVNASVGDLGCFEGDGGRGELVRDGGLEDEEGALYVTFTVICEKWFSGAVRAYVGRTTLRLATSMGDGGGERFGLGCQCEWHR